MKTYRCSEEQMEIRFEDAGSIWFLQGEACCRLDAAAPKDCFLSQHGNRITLRKKADFVSCGFVPSVRQDITIASPESASLQQNILLRGPLFVLVDQDHILMGEVPADLSVLAGKEPFWRIPMEPGGVRIGPSTPEETEWILFSTEGARTIHLPSKKKGSIPGIETTGEGRSAVLTPALQDGSVLFVPEGEEAALSGKIPDLGTKTFFPGKAFFAKRSASGLCLFGIHAGTGPDSGAEPEKGMGDGPAGNRVLLEARTEASLRTSDLSGWEQAVRALEKASGREDAVPCILLVRRRGIDPMVPAEEICRALGWKKVLAGRTLFPSKEDPAERFRRLLFRAKEQEAGCLLLFEDGECLIGNRTAVAQMRELRSQKEKNCALCIGVSFGDRGDLAMELRKEGEPVLEVDPGDAKPSYLAGVLLQDLKSSGAKVDPELVTAPAGKGVEAIPLVQFAEHNEKAAAPGTFENIREMHRIAALSLCSVQDGSIHRQQLQSAVPGRKADASWFRSPSRRPLRDSFDWMRVSFSERQMDRIFGLLQETENEAAAGRSMVFVLCGRPFSGRVTLSHAIAWIFCQHGMLGSGKICELLEEPEEKDGKTREAFPERTFYRAKSGGELLYLDTRPLFAAGRQTAERFLETFLQKIRNRGRGLPAVIAVEPSDAAAFRRMVSPAEDLRIRWFRMPDFEYEDLVSIFVFRMENAGEACEPGVLDLVRNLFAFTDTAGRNGRDVDLLLQKMRKNRQERQAHAGDHPALQDGRFLPADVPDDSAFLKGE